MKDLRKEALLRKEDILHMALGEELANTVLGEPDQSQIDKIIAIAFRMGATLEMEERFDKYEQLVEKYSKVVDKYTELIKE